jgi:2-polyprenyl-3-methyl-5-hydroxy-6-metoxy-1,4-benzoquinol methylase
MQDAPGLLPEPPSVGSLGQSYRSLAISSCKLLCSPREGDMTVARDPEHAETRMIHKLVDFAGKDVLEIGCGEGRLTWRYADQARSVLALDPDAEAIGQAHAQMPEPLRSRVTFQVADVTTADLPADAFDVLMLSWSL